MEHSAGGVVYHKEKGGDPIYLVLMSRRGIWEFPKGHIEKEENAKGAAMREVEEETGIRPMRLIDSFKFLISYVFYKDGERVSKDVVYYLMETNMTDVKISDEHLGFMWLGYESASNKLTHVNSKKLIVEANAWIRALDGVWRT